MDFKEFFQKRRSAYYKRLARYLKYVFNDFFLLFLFILLGAILYHYMNFISALRIDQYEVVIFAILILSFLPFLGRFESLIEPADCIFIAPLEGGMNIMMNEQRLYSLIMPALLFAIVSALLMPIFVFFGYANFSDWIVLFVISLALKMQDLYVQESRYKTWTVHWFSSYKVVRWLFYFALYVIAIYFDVWLGATLAVIFLLLSVSIYQAEFEHKRWNFLLLIADEEKRMSKLTRILNVFMDVKGVKEKPKRFAFLDPVVAGVTSETNNPYRYLFTRGFFRRSSYISLYLRLTAIGMLVLAWMPSAFWQNVLAILFLYMTAFQLIPLVYLYDRNSLIAVYPTDTSDKLQGFQALLLRILSIEALCFILATFVNFNILNIVILSASLSIFILLFIYLYVPRKIKSQKCI